MYIWSSGYQQLAAFEGFIVPCSLEIPIHEEGFKAEKKSFAMSSQNLRSKVIQLYKTLLYLGKDYPKGEDYFRARLKSAFMKNKDVTDPKELEMLIARGEYVVKEIEALYMLRKYRTLKKRYYPD